MQTIWGDPDRFVETYYSKYCKDSKSTDWRDWPYFAGDGAMEAEDGYFRILGRVDDVINVAGHRLGTKELESAALTVDGVAEAAAVPAFDDIRGRVPEMYIAVKSDVSDHDKISKEVIQALRSIIGPIARPAHVWVASDLPKTRSGKIMRRVIASISNFVDVGDITTLANPEVVEEIKNSVQNEKIKLDAVPKSVTPEMIEEIKRFGEN